MNIIEQLTALGISGHVYKNRKEILISCPFHEDHKPSCSVNLETGIWICYTGCGSGNWMQFLEGVRKDSNYAPLSMTDSSPEIAPNKEPVLKSLLQRGFTRDVLAKWGIVWDKTVGAMRLPVRNCVGEIEGNIWRYPVGITPKYRYEVGFAKSETLYGLWRLGKCPRIVLVEGPLDAIWVQEAGIPALAILGSSLSEQQIILLLTMDVQHVVLCFDNDTAGIRATQHATPMLRSKGLWVHRVTLPSNCNDIQEVKNVAAVIDKAELCVNGHGMVHPRYQRWLGRKEINSNAIWR